MPKLPVIFISHGPPKVAIKPCPVQHFLKQLGRELPRPLAILSISAHWESVDPLVTLGKHPGIIYDFGGPAALKSVTYDLPGAPDLADKVISTLQGRQIPAKGLLRGFDHGTWIPLKLIYPEADIPTVQLSIQTETTPGHHYRLGRHLASLREEGVLIMASGGAVHNLAEIGQYESNQEPPAYVRRFDAWLEEAIINRQIDVLLDYQRRGPEARRCHPYPAEHLLPIFVALGTAGPDPARKIHDSFMLDTLSMAAYAWG